MEVVLYSVQGLRHATRDFRRQGSGQQKGVYLKGTWSGIMSFRFIDGKFTPRKTLYHSFLRFGSTKVQFLLQSVSLKKMIVLI